MPLDALVSEASTEVEAGGRRWRLRRTDATRMALARRPALVVLSAEELARQGEAPLPPTSPEDVRARMVEQIAEAQRVARRQTPEQARALQEADASLVCAMVVAVELEEGWVPLTLTLDGEPAPAEGRLPLWCLPAGAEETLRLLCYAYQTGGQDGITVLREFLSGSWGAARSGPDSEAVRGEALRAASGY